MTDYNLNLELDSIVENFYSSYRVDNVFYKLREDAIIPTYIHRDDSGMDLYSCIDTPITLRPWKVVIVPTGITAKLPFNTELQIRSRSGLTAKNQVFVLNSPGTVDEGYQKTDADNAEIKVILANFSDEPFTVENHMRIAQGVLASVIKLVMPDDHVYKVRAGKGIGSTGVK